MDQAFTGIEEILKKMEEQAILMKSQEDIAQNNYTCDICKDEKGWTEWRDADVFGDGRIVRKEQVWVDCPCTKQ